MTNRISDAACALAIGMVAAPGQKALTGLPGEPGRNLRERGESRGKLAPVVNLTIRGSPIQRSSLGDNKK